MVAVPAEGCTRPSSMRRVVVLPEPLGPRKPVTRPGSTANERLAPARTGPKGFARPLIPIGSPRVVGPTVIRATLARAIWAIGVSPSRRRTGGTPRSGERAALDQLIGQQ